MESVAPPSAATEGPMEVTPKETPALTHAQGQDEVSVKTPAGATVTEGNEPQPNVEALSEKTKNAEDEMEVEVDKEKGEGEKEEVKEEALANGTGCEGSEAVSVRENEADVGNKQSAIPSVEELEKQAKFWQTKQILDELVRRDKEKWFLEPVDAESLGLADYHNIVKKPMDLGTIVKRFEAKKYDSHVQALDDVRLTFRNAILYNPADSYVSTAAVRHLKRFEGLVRKAFDAPEDIGTKVPESKVIVPTSLSDRLNDVEAKLEIQRRPELTEVALFLWLLSSAGSPFKVDSFTLQEFELSLLVPEANKVMACVHTVLLLPFREIELLQKSGFSDFERPIEWWVKQLLSQLKDWNLDRNELRHELEEIKRYGEHLYVPEQVDSVRAQKNFLDLLLRPFYDGDDEAKFDQMDEVLPFQSVEEYVRLSPTLRLLLLRSLCEWRGSGYPESSVRDHFRSFELESLRQPPIGLDHEGRRYYYFPQFYKDCRVYRETPMESKQEEEDFEEEEEEEAEEVVEVDPVKPWRRRQKIDAIWSGDGEFYPGKIKKVIGDGTYDVLFDDGDVETGIPHEKIRKHDPEDFKDNEEDRAQQPKTRRGSRSGSKASESVRRSPRGRKRARSETNESSVSPRSTRKAKEEASKRLKAGADESDWWKDSRRRSSRSRSKPKRIEEEIYGVEATRPKREKPKGRAKAVPAKSVPKKKDKTKGKSAKRTKTVEKTYPPERYYDGPEGRASKWELLCEDVEGLGRVIVDIKGFGNKFNQDLIQELVDLEEHMKNEMENLIKEQEKMKKRLKQSLAPRKRSSRIAESKLQKMQREEEEKRKRLLEEERQRQEAEERKRKKLRAERMREREEREIADALLKESNRRRREKEASSSAANAPPERRSTPAVLLQKQHKTQEVSDKSASSRQLKPREPRKSAAKKAVSSSKTKQSEERGSTVVPSKTVPVPSTKPAPSKPNVSNASNGVRLVSEKETLRPVAVIPARSTASARPSLHAKPSTLIKQPVSSKQTLADNPISTTKPALSSAQGEGISTGAPKSIPLLATSASQLVPPGSVVEKAPLTNTQDREDNSKDGGRLASASATIRNEPIPSNAQGTEGSKGVVTTSGHVAVARANQRPVLPVTIEKKPTLCSTSSTNASKCNAPAAGKIPGASESRHTTASTTIGNKQAVSSSLDADACKGGAASSLQVIAQPEGHRPLLPSTIGTKTTLGSAPKANISEEAARRSVQLTATSASRPVAPATIGKTQEHRTKNSGEVMTNIVKVNTNSAQDVPSRTEVTPVLQPRVTQKLQHQIQLSTEGSVERTTAAVPSAKSNGVSHVQEGTGLHNPRTDPIGPSGTLSSTEATRAADVQAVMSKVVQSVSDNSKIQGSVDDALLTVDGAKEECPSAKAKVNDLPRNPQDENRNVHYHGHGSF